MKKGALSLGLALLGAIAAAACAPSGDDASAESSAAATEAADVFWGDDRVGDRLKDFKANDACPNIPTSFSEVEACFGVGRKCTRKDSQEVFVIEEKQARGLDQPAVAAKEISPRAVVTGCNLGSLDDAKSVATSYSIMVGLFSPPAQVGETDPISLTPVEVMSYDRTTGLFNFYVFDESGVTRIFRDGTKVMERTFDAARGSASPAALSDTKRCFGCHVNGAPIMNEMTNPWTNWVSQAKAFPSTANLSGTTEELVSRAVPNSAKGTSSLAGALEPIMKAADAQYVSKGFGPRVLDGKETGGVGRLVKSVLCETELNYASSTDSVPMQIFWDTSVSSTLSKVSADGDAKIAFQVPIRSEVDRDVELFLVGKGILDATTVQAVRLVDDENDVFSKSRCALLPEVTNLTADNANERLRATLTTHLTGDKAFPWMATQPARGAYLTALLGTDASARTIARAAYMKELAARHKAARTAFGGDGQQAFIDKIASRKKQALAMFDNGGPVPVLDPEP